MTSAPSVVGEKRALDGALRGLAIGRLVVGAIARLSPETTSRLLLSGASPGPEYDYMTRVFGARAIALGTGYLASDRDARRLWQRLAFFCDVSDTIAGIAILRRGSLPTSAAVWFTALTGTYAAIGAARIIDDARGAE